MGRTSDLLKNMLNPFPSEGFNTDINLPTEELALRKYQTKQLVRHAGKNLLGWGGTFMALRMAVGQIDKSRQKKSDKKISSYLNARQPIISLDPNVEDEDQKKTKREMGVEKIAAEYGTSPLSQSVSQVRNFIGMMGRKDRANLHLAATLTASYGGGLIGWKIADKLLDRQRGNDLDKRISENRNEMDSLMHGEYLRTRGLDKGAAEEDMRPSSSLWKAMGAAWWVWAVGSMALAYRTSKAYMDQTDPARQRVKQLEDIARSQAKVNEAPTLINESKFNPAQTKGSLKPKKSQVKGLVSLPTPKKKTRIAK